MHVPRLINKKWAVPNYHYPIHISLADTVDRSLTGVQDLTSYAIPALPRDLIEHTSHSWSQWSVLDPPPHCWSFTSPNGDRYWYRSWHGLYVGNLIWGHHGLIYLLRTSDPQKVNKIRKQSKDLRCIYKYLLDRHLKGKNEHWRRMIKPFFTTKILCLNISDNSCNKVNHKNVFLHIDYYHFIPYINIGVLYWPTQILVKRYRKDTCNKHSVYYV